MSFQSSTAPSRAPGLCFRAYPQISAWKSSFCPGRPRVHWALPNRDCVTSGNFWFCCVHRSRRITPSETHLTRLHSHQCPLLILSSVFHLPGSGERDSRAGFTVSLSTGRFTAQTQTQRWWQSECDLLDFTLPLSWEADEDVPNLCICYRLHIWATLGAVC